MSKVRRYMYLYVLYLRQQTLHNPDESVAIMCHCPRYKTMGNVKNRGNEVLRFIHARADIQIKTNEHISHGERLQTLPRT